MIQKLFLLWIGGGLGTLGRYFLSCWITSSWGSAFPWGTLVVNSLGCFVIGLCGAWILFEQPHESLKLFVMTGVLGGFTTFSAFSLEGVLLLRNQQWGWASAYIGGSVLLGLWATAMGMLAMRAVLKT